MSFENFFRASENDFQASTSWLQLAKEKDGNLISLYPGYGDSPPPPQIISNDHPSGRLVWMFSGTTQ